MIGIVDVLKAGAFLVTHSWIPNYELGDRMRKIYGNIFVLKIPLYNCNYLEWHFVFSFVCGTNLTEFQ